MNGARAVRSGFSRPLGLVMLLASAGIAFAQQSPVCRQIRGELAQVGSGGGTTRQSMQLRTELGRVRLAIQRNECNRSGFLVFGGPPPICSPLRAQAAQYEAQIRQIEGGGGAQRRAQLIAALDRYGCLAQPDQPQRGVIYASPREPNLFERLFGGSDRGSDGGSRAVIDPSPDNPEGANPDGETRERLGGRMAICVRTCDGYFFPVNFEGIGARDEYAPVCQSLCPAAETQVFFMPLGADIERAATRDGTPYMSLPAAKQYQQTRNSACTCKQPGQTWASAMKGVEDLVEARKGDIIVTREQADAMSRPKELKAAAAKKGKLATVAPEISEPPASPPESEIPTSGTASAGIGPRVQGDRTIATDGGVRQQAIGAGGEKKTIRNVAPELTGKELPIDLRGEARP